jgi:hypothetical protein
MISDNCFFHNKDLQAPPLGDGGKSHIFREEMCSIICFTDESGGRRGKWDHPGFVRERKKMISPLKLSRIESQTAFYYPIQDLSLS